MFKIREKQVSGNELLNEIIDSLMEENLYGTAYRKTRETTEYDKWIKETIGLGISIRKEMGPDRNLFMRHEELSALCESVLLQNAYKCGFLDGIEFISEIL